MSFKEGLFLRPLIIEPRSETDPSFPKMSNEEILLERADYYYVCWREMHARAEQLKIEYGSWARIPNKLRTNLANNLRYAGFTYEQGRGWYPPNSVALSSI